MLDLRTGVSLRSLTFKKKRRKKEKKKDQKISHYLVIPHQELMFVKNSLQGQILLHVFSFDM